jgi:PAS domain S-box-containing protein
MPEVQGKDEEIKILDKENKLLKETLKLSGIGSWELNLISKCLTWSDEAFRIFGYKAKEVTPSLELIIQLTPQADKDSVNKIFNNFFKQLNKSDNYYQTIIFPSGETRYLLNNYSVVYDVNKNPHRIFGTIQDVTERKQTSDALNESELKYKTLAEAANDYIFIIGNDGKVQYVNDYAAQQIKKKSKNIIGKNLKDIFPIDLYDRQQKNIMSVIKSGIPLVIETKSVFADREVWLSSSLSPIYDETGKVKSVLGISRDITKRKIAEKLMSISEEKYRELIEQAADSIFVGDTEGNFIEVNTKACELTGYNKNELLTMNMSDLFAKREMQTKPLRYDLLLNGEIVVSERKLTTKNKNTIPIEMNTVRMSNGTYQAIMRNVSERKRAEELLLKYQEELELLVMHRTQEFEKINAELKKENIDRLHTEKLLKFQLKEKEILLKEIHHRVKNNMQVIISLLNLQASSIEDVKMQEIYRESQNRIKSMALIHEKLYQSKDLTHINFSEYVSSLANYLAQTYLTDRHQIKIFTKTQDIPLEFDTVISLGLIINELVSNAMKYAFDKKSNGKIEISLKKDKGNQLNFYICDNGKGVPKNIDFRNTKSLGLQLVCSLTQQIGGTINMTNTNGTAYHIMFPHEQNE